MTSLLIVLGRIVLVFPLTAALLRRLKQRGGNASPGLLTGRLPQELGFDEPETMFLRLMYRARNDARVLSSEPVSKGHVLNGFASSPEAKHVRPHKKTRIDPPPYRPRSASSRQPGTRPGLCAGGCGDDQDLSAFRPGRESLRHGEGNFASDFRFERR